MRLLSREETIQLKEQVEQARERWRESLGRRQEAREARAKARGVEPADPEAAKQQRKERAALAKAMSKMLVPLAAIGARDAIEKALAQGASLKAATESGRTCAMAAIDGGHSQLALWLCDHPDYVWKADGPGGGGDTELLRAIGVDDVALCQALLERRPSLMLETYEGRWHVPKNQQDPMSIAMSQAPKTAGWMASAYPDLFQKWVAKQGAQVHEASVGALAEALSVGDFESADVLWPLLKKFAEAPGRLSPHADPKANRCAHALFAAVLKNDSAEALGWLLGASPSLTAKALDGGSIDSRVGGGCSYWAARRSGAPEVAQAFSQALDQASSAPGDLGLWAVKEGALDCFEFLMAIEPFREKFADCQSQSKAWVLALGEAREPAMVAAMERAGFDFSKEAAPGWGAAAAVLINGKIPTQKWLEMLGRDRAAWLAPSPATGLGPFELARSLGVSASDLAKWEAASEKATMRSSAGRLSQTKQAKTAREGLKSRARL